MFDRISTLTFGIRYSKSFRIPDIGGEIVDRFLYTKESPFDTDYFPQVTEFRDGGRLLLNKKTERFIRFNVSDIVFGMQVDTFDGAFRHVTEDILPFLKTDYFGKYKIGLIQRVGIILSHKLEPSPATQTIVSALTHKNITEANNFQIQFSQKLPVTTAQFKKGVNDYRNTIYTFLLDEQGFIADLDYQHYFAPDIEDIRDASPETIFQEAKAYTEKKFHPWLRLYEPHKK
jgi:hypothetical protein